MTEPLTPPEADLQDFPFMPLHVARLRDSDLAAEAHPEACWYAVMLWAASWHQLPAGSLPDNETVLTRLCGLGRDLKTFRKHRADAMRGFVLCSDGRWYHPVVAEQVNAAWAERVAYRARRERRSEIGKKAAAARWTEDAQSIGDGDASRMHDAPSGDASCIAHAMPKETGTGTGTELTADDTGATPASDWPSGSTQDHARMLCAAAETVHLDLARQPTLTTTLGRLHAWRKQGASWEHDVLPVVTSIAQKARRSISSWKFFDDAIAQSIADNRAALIIPEASREGPTHVVRRDARYDAKVINLGNHLAGAEQAAGVLADRRAL